MLVELITGPIATETSEWSVFQILQKSQLLNKKLVCIFSFLFSLTMLLSLIQQVVNDGGNITNIQPAVIVQVSIGIILAITA